LQIYNDQRGLEIGSRHGVLMYQDWTTVSV
jgi:hypothetical protein